MCPCLAREKRVQFPDRRSVVTWSWAGRDQKTGFSKVCPRYMLTRAGKNLPSLIGILSCDVIAGKIRDQAIIYDANGKPIKPVWPWKWLPSPLTRPLTFGQFLTLFILFYPFCWWNLSQIHNHARLTSLYFDAQQWRGSQLVLSLPPSVTLVERGHLALPNALGGWIPGSRHSGQRGRHKAICWCWPRCSCLSRDKGEKHIHTTVKQQWCICSH